MLTIGGFQVFMGHVNQGKTNFLWCIGDREWCAESVLSVGDFNVVRSLSEKMNSNSLTISMICFDSLIRELVLCDPPLLNAKFTRSNSRASSICCSLYRFLFPEGWLDFFPMLSTNGLIQNYIRSLPFNFGHFKRNLGYWLLSNSRMCGLSIKISRKNLQYGGTIKISRLGMI